MQREILLIGGGHAHVEVIRRWAIAPPENASLTVVDPNPRPVYAGMVPGYVAGQYDRSDLAIDLERLCARADARDAPVLSPYSYRGCSSHPPPFVR